MNHKIRGWRERLGLLGEPRQQHVTVRAVAEHQRHPAPVVVGDASVEAHRLRDADDASGRGGVPDDAVAGVAHASTGGAA